MYEGMSKLKLYEDSSCLIELPRAYNGNYVVNTSIPTGNSDISFSKHIYIKNVGTHTAYNIALSKLFGDKDVTLGLDSNKLYSKKTAVAKLTVNFSKGEKYSGSVQVRLEYDNIP